MRHLVRPATALLTGRRAVTPQRRAGPLHRRLIRPRAEPLTATRPRPRAGLTRPSPPPFGADRITQHRPLALRQEARIPVDAELRITIAQADVPGVATKAISVSVISPPAKTKDAPRIHAPRPPRAIPQARRQGVGPRAKRPTRPVIRQVANPPAKTMAPPTPVINAPFTRRPSPQRPKVEPVPPRRPAPPAALIGAL